MPCEFCPYHGGPCALCAENWPEDPGPEWGWIVATIVANVLVVFLVMWLLLGT